MTRFIISLTLILLTLNVQSQKLKIQAIYSSENKPYKVDQVFVSGDSTYYVNHRNKRSHCILETKKRSGDTLIVSQSFYQLHLKQRIPFNPNNAVIVYSPELNNDSLNAEKKKDVDLVGKIVNGQVKTSFDSLTLFVVYQAYSVNGQLLKSKTLNQELQDILISTRSDKPYQIQFNTHFIERDYNSIISYTFNEDTTIINAHYQSPDYNIYRNYEIKDSTFIRYQSNGKQESEKFINPNGILYRFMYNEVAYYDAPFNITLFSDLNYGYILEWKSYNGRISWYKYNFKKDGQPEDCIVYQNNKPIRSIEYSYYD